MRPSPVYEVVGRVGVRVKGVRVAKDFGVAVGRGPVENHAGAFRDLASTGTCDRAGRHSLACNERVVDPDALVDDPVEFACSALVGLAAGEVGDTAVEVLVRKHLSHHNAHALCEGAQIARGPVAQDGHDLVGVELAALHQFGGQLGRYGFGEHGVGTRSINALADDLIERRSYSRVALGLTGTLGSHVGIHPLEESTLQFCWPAEPRALRADGELSAKVVDCVELPAHGKRAHQFVSEIAEHWLQPAHDLWSHVGVHERTERGVLLAVHGVGDVQEPGGGARIHLGVVGSGNNLSV